MIYVSLKSISNTTIINKHYTDLHSSLGVAHKIVFFLITQVRMRKKILFLSPNISLKIIHSFKDFISIDISL